MFIKLYLVYNTPEDLPGPQVSYSPLIGRELNKIIQCMTKSRKSTQTPLEKKKVFLV